VDLLRREAYNIIYKVLKDHHHSDRLLEQKVKKLVNDGKTLEETQAEFNENEARLVESVYGELN